MTPAALPGGSRITANPPGRLAWVLLAITYLASARDTNLARWPGDRLGRVEALAVLQTLNAELLSHDSATATLEHWPSLCTFKGARPRTTYRSRKAYCSRRLMPRVRSMYFS